MGASEFSISVKAKTAKEAFSIAVENAKILLILLKN